MPADACPSAPLAVGRGWHAAAAAGSALEPGAPTFWQDAYCLRRLPDGRVACPGFLRPLAPHVLAAGKAAILLRHSSNKDRRCQGIRTQGLGTQVPGY